METRQIMIANNKTQQRYTIQSAATTLGELKAQLREQGIDYSGMTFTEGISKTQLLGDDAQLPTQVMYKGAPTNNLVMLLTNPNKQIASGAMDRKEAYRMVQAMNLQAAIQEGENQNYTRVSTAILESYIDAARNGGHSEALEETRNELNNLGREKDEEVNTPSTEAPKATVLPDVKTAPHAQTVEWFYAGIKSMVADNLLYAEDVVVIANLTTELAARMLETRPEITNDDIDDMMDSIM